MTTQKTNIKTVDEIIETIRKNYPNLNYESNDRDHVYDEILKICEKLNLKHSIEHCCEWGIKPKITAAFSEAICLEIDIGSMNNLMKANLREVSDETIKGMMRLFEKMIPMIVAGKLSLRSIYHPFMFCCQRLLSLIIIKRVRNIPLEVLNEFLCMKRLTSPFNKRLGNETKEQMVTLLKKLLEYLKDYDGELHELICELAINIGSQESFETINKILLLENIPTSLRTFLTENINDIVEGNDADNILKALSECPEKYVIENLKKRW